MELQDRLYEAPHRLGNGRDTDELVHRAQLGDEQATVAVYLATMPLVERVARRCMPNPLDAEAVAAAAAERVLVEGIYKKRYQDQEGRGSFSGWAATVTHNLAATAIRRAIRGPRFYPTEYPSISREAEQKVTASAEDVVIEEEAMERIHALFDNAGIKPQLSEAFILHWFGDLSYAQIANVQGVKSTTVGTRILRAREHLLTYYANQGAATATPSTLLAAYSKARVT